MTKITVAALQLAFSAGTVANTVTSPSWCGGAPKGAEVVLPPELFEGPYFCRVEDETLFADARPTAEHPSVLAMQELAKELRIWIPTGFSRPTGRTIIIRWCAPTARSGSIAKPSLTVRAMRKNSISGPEIGFKVGWAHHATLASGLLGPVVSRRRARC
jgi:hypothetical protein